MKIASRVAKARAAFANLWQRWHRRGIRHSLKGSIHNATDHITSTYGFQISAPRWKCSAFLCSTTDFSEALTESDRNITWVMTRCAVVCPVYATLCWLGKSFSIVFGGLDKFYYLLFFMPVPGKSEKSNATIKLWLEKNVWKLVLVCNRLLLSTFLMRTDDNFRWLVTLRDMVWIWSWWGQCCISRLCPPKTNTETLK